MRTGNVASYVSTAYIFSLLRISFLKDSFLKIRL
jgi:hypothetical protein